MAWAGDLAGLGVLAVACGWPSQGGRQKELLLISGLGPLLSVLVAAAASAGPAEQGGAGGGGLGVAQRLCVHPAATSLGSASFAAYLFAMAVVALADAAGAPVLDGFEVQVRTAACHCRPALCHRLFPPQGGWFPVVFVCIWCWAVWWSGAVDRPVGAILRRWRGPPARRVPAAKHKPRRD